MAIIHIPTTPEVRKFVLHEHREQVYYRTDRSANEPIIKLNLKMLLGNMIACLMNDDLTHFRPQKRPQQYLTFEISKRFDQSWLTEDKAKRISLHLDRYFKDDFCRYVDFSVSYGLEVERALEQYRENYGIEEDDFSFDTMRSYYYRYGKKTIMINEKRPSNRCPGDKRLTRGGATVKTGPSPAETRQLSVSTPGVAMLGTVA